MGSRSLVRCKKPLETYITLRVTGWYKRDNSIYVTICKRYLENLDYFVYIGPKRGISSPIGKNISLAILQYTRS